jgi:hypothetical protein
MYTKISDSHPAPHRKYVVKRDNIIFTATPCYGLHEPWWVIRIMGDKYEAPPEPMLNDDSWVLLDDFLKTANEIFKEHGIK